jgi:hypothetical protein
LTFALGLPSIPIRTRLPAIATAVVAIAAIDVNREPSGQREPPLATVYQVPGVAAGSGVLLTLVGRQQRVRRAGNAVLASRIENVHDAIVAILRRVDGR